MYKRGIDQWWYHKAHSAVENNAKIIYVTCGWERFYWGIILNENRSDLVPYCLSLP